MTDEDIISNVIDREGRQFTNDPVDHGGPTKFGITLVDLCEWRGRDDLTASDVEHMSETEARAIYRRRYIVDPGFDRITNDWLRAFLVDTGVLQGTRVAIKFLQYAVGVDVDGVLGPVTLAAVARADLATLRRQLNARRLSHLAACALADVPVDVVQSTNLKYLRGWLNRATQFL